jgi:cytochrome c6
MVASRLVKSFQWLCAAMFVFAFVFSALSGSTASADDKNQGEKLFSNNCASCHAGGKNTIDPKKPVIGSKKLASKAAFKSFLEVQNGMMPPFKGIAAKDEALTALYTYVKTLK